MLQIYLLVLYLLVGYNYQGWCGISSISAANYLLMAGDNPAAGCEY